MADTGYQKGLLRFIMMFNAAVNNFRFYASGHPRTRRCLDDACRVLMELFRLNDRITVVIIENEIVVDNVPLKSREAHLGKFITLLKETGIERLTFCQGLSEQELEDFITQCAQPEATAVKSTSNIRIGKVGLAVRDGSTTSAATEATEADDLQEVLNPALAARQELFDDLRNTLGDIKRRRHIDFERLGGMTDTLARGFSRGLDPLSLLSVPDAVDDQIAAHMLNVGVLVTSQAVFLGFKGKILKQISTGSMISDVGKLLVPPEIISKSSVLTPGERKIIESHTVRGARYILGLKDFPRLAVLCALEHHRRYDGSGYPVLSAAWEPVIVSQMVAIADAYAAMRSPRPYRDALSHRQIVQILKKESGLAYNPRLLNYFLQVISR